MKRTLTTVAIGSGLLVLVGLALVRRGLAVEGKAPPSPAVPTARASGDPGAPEGTSPEQSAAPGISSDAVLRTQNGGPPEIASPRALRHAEQDFWEDLGALLELRRTTEPAKYREKVSALTAEYLGLDKSRAGQFDRTAGRATEEIGRTWKLRNESIEALSAALPLEEREREEQRIQEVYEAAKVQALAPLESLLDGSPRHESFRRRLGEWIDAVR